MKKSGQGVHTYGLSQARIVDNFYGLLWDSHDLERRPRDDLVDLDLHVLGPLVPGGGVHARRPRPLPCQGHEADPDLGMEAEAEPPTGSSIVHFRFRFGFL